MTSWRSFVALASVSVAIATTTAGCPESTGRSIGTLSCSLAPGDGGAFAGLPPGAFCADYGGDVIPTACPANYEAVGACPSAGRTGRCDVTTTTSAGRSETALYSYDGIPTDAARSGCDAAGGTFTAL